MEFKIGEKVVIKGSEGAFPYEIENVLRGERGGIRYYVLKELAGIFSQDDLEKCTRNPEFCITSETNGKEVTVFVWECGDDPDGADDRLVHTATGKLRDGSAKSFAGAASFAMRTIWHDLGGGYNDR